MIGCIAYTRYSVTELLGMRGDVNLDKDKLAIIIINYNGIDDTLECLESIRKADLLEQVILVDNYSEKDECTAIKKRFPSISIIKNRKNLGFAGGNNVGIKYAMDLGKEYIALLNNDTIVAKDMFYRLISEMEEYKVVVPQMLYYSDSNEIWYGGGHINFKTGNAIHDSNKYEKKECDFATGCCILVKSSVFDDIGFLNEKYFMYCEDTDFCLRLIEKGIKILYIPSAKLWHKVGQTSGVNTPFSTYYTVRNKLYYISKYKHLFGKFIYLVILYWLMRKIIFHAFKQDGIAYASTIAYKDFRSGIMGEVSSDRYIR